MESSSRITALRSIQTDDQPFLIELFVSTRSNEFQMLPQAQQSALLQIQFTAQQHHYQAEYPAAEWLLIMSQTHPVGRLVIDRSSNLVQIIDIALMPAFQNQGIGTSLLQEIMLESQKTQRPIHLQVAHDNPARRLYQRLGFVAISDTDMYCQMEWHPH